jgi:hypothetical protein
MRHSSRLVQLGSGVSLRKVIAGLIQRPKGKWHSMSRWVIVLAMVGFVGEAITQVLGRTILTESEIVSILGVLFGCLSMSEMFFSSLQRLTD